jgi:hypothetical protein
VAPLALLPEHLGALLWRLLNAGVFLAGMACWARMLLPPDLGRDRQALLFLLALPLVVGSINNAQANALMTGLILLALAAAASERWNWAALGIALACVLKIYPVAVGLLLALVYPRRFTVRFGAALALGVGLPFLLQDPAYVARQYAHWYCALQADDRSAWDLRSSYRDLWLLIRLVGLPISRHAYLIVQLGAAGMVAALCWWQARQKAKQRVVLNTILGLGACWMTLCGPATESCTYILLAPTLAWAVLEAWHRPDAPAPGPSRPWRCGLVWTLAASYAVFLSSFVATWFPGVARLHALGTHPLAALLLLSALVCTSLTGGGMARAAQDLPVAACSQQAA